MNDFVEFIKEAALGKPGLEPVQPLDGRVVDIDSRLRTVATLTWIGAVFVFGVTVWMAVLLLGDTETIDTGRLVFYGAVLVSGIVLASAIKSWHFQMQSDSQLMKEILRLSATETE